MTTVAQRRTNVQEQLAELHAQKDANELEMARIKMQLEQARFHAASTGEYSDPNWYARAQYALRMRGREAQKLQVKIGEVGRLLRKLNNAQIEQCFVESARKHLAREVFAQIWAQAQELSTERAGGDDDATQASRGPSDDAVRVVQVTRARSPNASRA